MRKKMRCLVWYFFIQSINISDSLVSVTLSVVQTTQTSQKMTFPNIFVTLWANFGRPKMTNFAIEPRQWFISSVTPYKK